MSDPTSADRAGVPPSGTRERLLDAAAALFYAEGVNVGVEALCKRAGVSKRSMYQLFGSKDEVVAASLDRMAPRVVAALLPEGDGGTPRERIMHVFVRLEELASSPQYKGCPFVAVAVEVKSPQHPGAVVARRHKEGLTAFFEREAARSGAADPALLARQLTVVYDGAGTGAVVRGEPVTGLAVTTAAVLLDAAGVTDPVRDAPRRARRARRSARGST